MELDENEREAFDALVSQLEAEDKGLGARSLRRSRLSVHLGGIAGSILAGSAGLLLLPVAASTRLYPLGLLGFAVAVWAAVRLLEAFKPDPETGRRATDGSFARHVEHTTPAGHVVTRRTLLLPGRLVLGLVTFVAVLLIF